MGDHNSDGTVLLEGISIGDHTSMTVEMVAGNSQVRPLEEDHDRLLHDELRSESKGGAVAKDWPSPSRRPRALAESYQCVSNY
jgi:hypothetical protein